MKKTVLSGIVYLLLSGTMVLSGCGRGGEAQTKCPMCGREIDRDIYVDYAGKRVYVCSEMCKAPFEADPETFVKKLSDGGVVLEDIAEGDSSHDQ